MLHLKCFSYNPFCERTSVVWDDSRECLICDPGFCSQSEEKSLLDLLEAEKLRPVAIILTHAHFDHLLGVGRLLEIYDIPVYMNPADRPWLPLNIREAALSGFPTPPEDFPTVDALDGTRISCGSLVFEVITTPGHSAGSVSYYCDSERLLLSGDTLFRGTIGRTDLPGGDYDRIMESITGKLMGLAGEVEVIPGHGPTTTIADERQKNPFLVPFNEPFED